MLLWSWAPNRVSSFPSFSPALCPLFLFSAAIASKALKRRRRRGRRKKIYIHGQGVGRTLVWQTLLKMSHLNTLLPPCIPSSPRLSLVCHFYGLPEESLPRPTLRLCLGQGGWAFFFFLDVRGALITHEIDLARRKKKKKKWRERDVQTCREQLRHFCQ